MREKPHRNPPDFESALRELEQIVEAIETGKLGLEEGLARYQRGNQLIQHCRNVLDKAQEQLSSLAGAESDQCKMMNDESEPQA